MQLSDFIHFFGFEHGCRLHRSLRASLKLRRVRVTRAPGLERRARVQPSGEGPI